MQARYCKTPPLQPQELSPDMICKPREHVHVPCAQREGEQHGVVWKPNDGPRSMATPSVVLMNLR